MSDTAQHTPTGPATIPQPGEAMTKDLLTTHLFTHPHQGTGRGEALDHLATLIELTADELDTTTRSIHHQVATARAQLDTLAAGGALSPISDEPVMTKTGSRPGPPHRHRPHPDPPPPPAHPHLPPAQHPHPE